MIIHIITVVYKIPQHKMTKVKIIMMKRETHTAKEKEMASTPVFLPGGFQGWGSPLGCRPWGCTESDTTEAT